ncbi:ornithine carbamoyltransferase [Phytomonospora endophytica]|uniref:Ornithine carbamoyltransferase n=1 Tax=Phytomonospora endophytica TaxID=714109 RepID=A0A841FY90_9ACTN|nr:ornithine carbamoyltransferase [Phytomonospora endophytica]MBB6038688.1 ornithine carbamoyltransferase [Phytomonospora endophytica]GIG69167.1 ornithine carbamoyltransferase [Phytomonospora endophytica]
MANHFISTNDVSNDVLRALVDRAVEFGHGRVRQTLTGKLVGLYFRRSSTRTRTAFWTGALRLGAQVVTFGPNDLQVTTGETWGDTTQVLSGYLDGFVARTNDTMEELRELTDQNQMAVINALTAHEHPTQAIADLTTITEEFGDLGGVHVLYVGEGNSTAAALAFTLGRIRGARLTVLSPRGYGLPADSLEIAGRLAGDNGGIVEQRFELDDAPTDVNVVYTSRWQTMGVAKADPNWQLGFTPYRVTQELMKRVSGDDTIFMHDLPAVRGGDVDDAVLDGPQSRAFRQAYHKMTAAMAILEWCVGTETGDPA